MEWETIGEYGWGKWMGIKGKRNKRPNHSRVDDHDRSGCSGTLKYSADGNTFRIELLKKQHETYHEMRKACHCH